jgi:hypothetical protein
MMGDWTFSKHAIEKALERGFDPADLRECLLRPEQTYQSHHRYGPDVQIFQRGRVALAVNPQSRTVITCLHRVQHLWGAQAVA